MTLQAAVMYFHYTESCPFSPDVVIQCLFSKPWLSLLESSTIYINTFLLIYLSCSSVIQDVQDGSSQGHNSAYTRDGKKQPKCYAECQLC